MTLEICHFRFGVNSSYIKVLVTLFSRFSGPNSRKNMLASTMTGRLVLGNTAGSYMSGSEGSR